MSLERVQECYQTNALVDLRLKTEHHAPTTTPRFSSRQMFSFLYQTYPRGLPQQKKSEISCRRTEVHAISSKTLSVQSTSPTLYIVQVHVNGASSSLINPYSNCIFRLLHCSVLVLIWLVVAVVVYIQCKLQQIMVI